MQGLNTKHTLNMQYNAINNLIKQQSLICINDKMIINSMNKRNLLTTCFLLFSFLIKGQELKVINSIREYRKTLKQDTNNQMVRVQQIIPTAVMDIRYATTNNFTGEILYPPSFEVFLRKPVADSLVKIQSELNNQGFGLKIFDAYRPYDVTVKMWDLIHDERYVANPAKGSGHNRGISVDLTIIDLSTGKELYMGTGYDHFSDTAHHSFKKLPPNVLKNREFLKSIMEKHGFKPLETEWWHYHLVWPNNFEVLNLQPRQLKKIKL